MFNWDYFTEEFSRLVTLNTKGDLGKLMINNFSTTGAFERIKYACTTQKLLAFYLNCLILSHQAFVYLILGKGAKTSSKSDAKEAFEKRCAEGSKKGAQNASRG